MDVMRCNRLTTHICPAVPSCPTTHNSRMFFESDGGFSSLGMVVALLLTLTLIFSAAQVYRISSASSDIQDVADASALAAQNQVAEFMIVARVCDAVVLSLSLAALACAGFGVAALCTPKTALLSEQLLESSRTLFEARKSFAQKAANGLNTIQKALPFLAAARAACVAQANNAATPQANYLALAILEPQEGAEFEFEQDEQGEELLDQIEQDAQSVRDAAQAAEDAAQKANESKQRAFEHDCGANPNYCMYERAKNAVGFGGNISASIDTWHFSDALKRAQDYYLERSKSDTPASNSIKDLGQSQLRKRFYRYAYEKISQGYVIETSESFDADFPLLPKSTAQTAQTELFEEAIYPVTEVDGSLCMHAWDGCPNASGVLYTASISELQAGGFTTCPLCEFEAQSMGSIASASSSIENGFEYHYRIVAQEAQNYKEAFEQAQPYRSEVQEKTKPWLESIKELLTQSASMRLFAEPPGSLGTIVLVVNLGEMPTSTGFKSSFVTYEGTLGARAAVAGATMIEEDSGEGATVLSSLLDTISESVEVTGVLDFVLECWSKLLEAYATGQSALSCAIEDGLNSMPLVGASKLGSWVKKQITSKIEAVGLQPAKLNALKPVIVNTKDIAEKGSDAFSVRFLAIKNATSALSGDADAFAQIASSVELRAIELLGVEDGTIELATIEPFGSDGPSIPITLSLPSTISSATESLYQRIAAAISSITARIVSEGQWQ